MSMIERAEELVTVFGGGGFVGRYVCESLLKSGVRVRIAQRNPRQAYIIQPLAEVGEFGKAMQSVHVEGARNVAEAAAELGLQALVHISAIGADRDSQSAYGRTKGEGEAAVRKAFPVATIIRPSLVFGPEDNLTNRFAKLARLPVLPVIAAKRNFRPVYVRDLARAIALAALDPQYCERTYEIG